MGEVLLEARGIRTDEGKAFPGLTTKVQAAELWVSSDVARDFRVAGNYETCTPDAPLYELQAFDCGCLSVPLLSLYSPPRSA
jgi:hypothetical protein